MIFDDTFAKDDVVKLTKDFGKYKKESLYKICHSVMKSHNQIHLYNDFSDTKKGWFIADRKYVEKITQGESV